MSHGAASQLLVAVQWKDKRAARPCDFIDRTGFRTVLPFEPYEGVFVQVWFRDARSRGTGVEVQGVVRTVYHGLSPDEEARVTIAFAPDTERSLIDRILTMGVGHGVADPSALPEPPRPPAPAPATGPRLGPAVHTPRKGQDGLGRGRPAGQVQVWVLRPHAVASGLQALLAGTLRLPDVHLAPDALDKVVVQVNLGDRVLLLPCQVRYQVEPGLPDAGAVVALGRVPVVVRARVAEAAAQAGPRGVGHAAVDAPGPAQPTPASRRRVGTPRPSRSRDALAAAQAAGAAESSAPDEDRVQVSRTPSPAQRAEASPTPRAVGRDRSPTPPAGGHTAGLDDPLQVGGLLAHASAGAARLRGGPRTPPPSLTPPSPTPPPATGSAPRTPPAPSPTPASRATASEPVGAPAAAPPAPPASGLRRARLRPSTSQPGRTRLASGPPPVVVDPAGGPVRSEASSMPPAGVRYHLAAAMLSGLGTPPAAARRPKGRARVEDD